MPGIICNIKTNHDLVKYFFCFIFFSFQICLFFCLHRNRNLHDKFKILTIGNNLFSGGFLGLDNIGVFDRSKPLPTGGDLQQADGTSWMAFYCLYMLKIAVELALKVCWIFFLQGKIYSAC